MNTQARWHTTTLLLNISSFLACILLPISLVVGPGFMEIILGVSMALWLGHCFQKKDWRWIREPWIKIAILLWLYLVIRGIFSIDPKGSCLAAISWGRFILLGAAFQFHILSSPHWHRIFLYTLAIVLIYALGCSFYEYVTNMTIWGIPRENPTRLWGPFNRPKVGIFEVKFVWPVFMALVWGGNLSKKMKITLSIMSISILSFFLLLTGERMAILLFLLGGLIILSLYQPVRKLFLSLGILGIATLIGFYFYTKTPEATTEPTLKTTLEDRYIHQTWDHFSDLFEAPHSALIKGAWTVFKSNPVFGIGLKNYSKICPSMNINIISRFERCSTHPHQIYIQWLMSGGIIGFSLLLALIGSWGYALKQNCQSWRKDPLTVGLCATLCMQLWPIATTGSFFNGWTGMLFWIIIGWLMARLRTHSLETKKL